MSTKKYLDENGLTYFWSKVKAKIQNTDEMPIGTVVDFDGQVSNIPDGWEQISSNIKTETTTSDNDAYSCTYVNGELSYLETYCGALEDEIEKRPQPYVLYSNSTGTTSNFTLSDNINRYKKIEVAYITNDDNQGIKALYNNNTSSGQMCINELWTSSGTGDIMYIKSLLVSFSGKNVTLSNGYETYFNSNGFTRNTSSNIKVKYVIGYK